MNIESINTDIDNIEIIKPNLKLTNEEKKQLFDNLAIARMELSNDKDDNLFHKIWRKLL